MTKRQKYIASCSNPYYANYATAEEVRAAKKLARGKFWFDKDFGHYCSFSPGGLRHFFGYGETNHKDSGLQNNVFDFLNKIKKLKAKRAAELWAAGFCKHALLIQDYLDL